MSDLRKLTERPVAVDIVIPADKGIEHVSANPFELPPSGHTEYTLRHVMRLLSIAENNIGHNGRNRREAVVNASNADSPLPPPFQTFGKARRPAKQLRVYGLDRQRLCRCRALMFTPRNIPAAL